MGLADLSPRNAFLFRNTLSLRGELVAGRVVRRFALLGLLAFGLSACSWDNNYDEDPEFGGSVGDGPVVNAEITITDGNGELVKKIRSDGAASYLVEVPAETIFPLLLSADGGTDIVTGEAPTFTMLSAMIDKDQTVANINPVSTLVVRTAQCMPGGLSDTNVGIAIGLVKENLSFGLDPGLVPNPVTTPVNVWNVASVIKANEAAAEMVRGTAAALIGTADETSQDEVMIQLGCDLADRKLDGLGNGVSPRLAATSQAVAAQILAEAVRNEVGVNGVNATAALDAAVPVAVPGATATMAGVTLTGGLLEQLRIALQAALTAEASESLVLLARAVEEDIAPGSAPVDIISTVSVDIPDDLIAAVASMASADDATILLANQRVAEAPTAPRPSITTFRAMPSSVQPDDQSTLDWEVNQVTACAGAGGWSGLKDVPVDSQFTVPLPRTTTFDLICAGVGGTTTESLIVTVASSTSSPTPTVTLTATPSNVAHNGTTTLDWASSDATSCSASGDWSGNKASSGSEITAPLTADASFSLTCTGAGGSATDSVTVTVAAPSTPDPAPVVSLTATPSSVAYNAATRLTWTVSNASSCTASGGWSGSKSSSGGSQTINSMTASATFDLDCTGSGGSGSDSVTVVVAPAPLPTVSLTATPSSVAFDGSTTLSWTVSDATSCSASGDWSGVKATDDSETVSSLTADSSFTLTCSGPGGNRAATVLVSVGAAPTPTLTFTAQPTSVPQNGSSQLNWTGGNVNSCAATGDWSGAKPTSGSESTGQLTVAQSYTLTCTGVGGNITEMVTVTIDQGTGTATLSWTPPTKNTDDSDLNDLAGYRIYYGPNNGGPYITTIDVNDPGASSYDVTNLSAGTYYFVITALNSSSVESVHSNQASGSFP